MNPPFYSPLSKEKLVSHYKAALSQRNKKSVSGHFSGALFQV